MAPAKRCLLRIRRNPRMGMRAFAGWLLLLLALSVFCDVRSGNVGRAYPVWTGPQWPSQAEWGVFAVFAAAMFAWVWTDLPAAHGQIIRLRWWSRRNPLPKWLPWSIIIACCVCIAYSVWRITEG